MSEEITDEELNEIIEKVQYVFSGGEKDLREKMRKSLNILYRVLDSRREKKVNRNEGHGHVFPRPDGVRARCGGPAICGECSSELARRNGGA